MPKPPIAVGQKGVVQVRVEKVRIGGREFSAHQHRHEAAYQIKDERRNQVLNANYLMVDVEGEVVVPLPFIGMGVAD